MDPNTVIVHANDFDLVIQETKLGAAKFYLCLQLLENEGLIRRVFKGNGKRMLFVKMLPPILQTAATAPVPV